jgi:hypothetical protein
MSIAPGRSSNRKSNGFPATTIPAPSSP